jgi:hypothetical protein
MSNILAEHHVLKLPELKPCPFCNSGTIRFTIMNGKTAADIGSGSEIWIVACLCGACGPNKSSAIAAIKAWNHRV